jgi:hypothetical protein
MEILFCGRQIAIVEDVKYVMITNVGQGVGEII